MRTSPFVAVAQYWKKEYSPHGRSSASSAGATSRELEDPVFTAGVERDIGKKKERMGRKIGKA